jgi:hypothetical protein
MRLVICAAVGFGLVSPGLAWGDLGHRTVAYLAQKYLQPSTIDYLNAILVNDKGYDFSDAATWADAIRPGRPLTKPWHYM